MVRLIFFLYNLLFGIEIYNVVTISGKCYTVYIRLIGHIEAKNIRVVSVRNTTVSMFCHISEISGLARTCKTDTADKHRRFVEGNFE